MQVKCFYCLVTLLKIQFDHVHHKKTQLMVYAPVGLFIALKDDFRLLA